MERHKQFPDATETLIEAYAFAEYKKAINDLMVFAKVNHIENTNLTVIVMSDFDWKQWKDLETSHWYLNRPRLDVNGL